MKIPESETADVLRAVRKADTVLLKSKNQGPEALVQRSLKQVCLGGAPREFGKLKAFP